MHGEKGTFVLENRNERILHLGTSPIACFLFANVSRGGHTSASSPKFWLAGLSATPGAVSRFSQLAGVAKHQNGRHSNEQSVLRKWRLAPAGLS